MKQIKQILFPTDFSEPAKGAFLYALHLAKQTGATIKLVHVFRGDFGVPVPEVMAYQMLDARKAESESKIIEFAKVQTDNGLSGIEVTTEILVGLAMDVVVDLAASKESPVDLIVMGTKGEHNVAEVVFGSVTTGVIANASCPVLAIPEGVPYKDIKSIAYATDLKSESMESVTEAAAIAQLFQAELHCVRVDTKGQDISKEMEAFNELTGQLSNQNISLAEVGSDTIAHGLDQYVHENGIQLLLMSRPQRNLLASIFHRSVTKQVALDTTLPLMIFRR